MTTVNTNNTTANASSLANAAGKSMSKLGINDFIALMTTQMKYQDPTNPQDSSAFVAQLAQFSSVSGIQEMNASVSSLLEQMRSAQALNATALVGHGVLAQTDTAVLSEGEGLTGEVVTPTGASNITLVVNDSSGAIVRQFTVPATSGTSAFAWDGKNDAGEPIKAGTYTVNAIASVYGTSEQVATAFNTKVDSVTIDPADNSLTLNTANLGPIELADIRRVL